MRPNTVQIWQGRSAFSDDPIVAIVTGLARDSHNPKTGPMAQLWILRSDLSPLAAIDSRRDYAICGDCKLRGSSTSDRTCYVLVKNAPLQIFRAFDAGRYPQMDPADVNTILRRDARTVRLGAYGEPTALPLWVLADLTSGLDWTGYTHQWKTKHAYRKLLMASVDTIAESIDARSRGWRTFRSRSADDTLQAGEITCPAAAESGHLTTCNACLLCDGRRTDDDKRANIAIVVHGNGRRNFERCIQ